MTKYLVDTNYLLSDNLDSLKEYDIVITDLVMREIESLERKKGDRQLQFQIRQAKRWIELNVESFDHTHDVDYTLIYDEEYVDNQLVQVCITRGYGLISNDLLIKDKARAERIEILEVDSTDDYVEFKGFKDVWLLDKDYKELYQNLDDNKYELLVNECLVIYDMITGDFLDVLVWNGEYHETLNRKGFKTQMFDDFKALDPYQVIAQNSIMRNKVTSIRGGAGSGKTKIAIETAWYLMERGLFDKLYLFYNFDSVENSNELGFYKGDKVDKMLQQMPFLKNKFGSEIILRDLIAREKIEINPYSDIRGMDIGSGEERAIAIFCEAQNLTPYLLKTGLQRIGENAKAIVEGDFGGQVDKDLYRFNNGMKRLSTILRGNKIYGEIELQNVYRSELAELLEDM